MSSDLRPKKWPHFMGEKKRPDQLYTSSKVLGQLYDQVERAGFEPAYTAPFNERIIHAFAQSQQALEDARALKKEYDGQIQRIMAQHAIRNEFEVWSTFVMEHNNANDYKFHEEIGRVANTLKQRFRDLCFEKAGGKQYEQIAPFAAAIYMVTAEEVTAAVKEHKGITDTEGPQPPKRIMTVNSMPKMSFPWIFQEVLGKIANDRTEGSVMKDKKIVTIVLQSSPTLLKENAALFQGNIAQDHSTSILGNSPKLKDNTVPFEGSLVQDHPTTVEEAHHSQTHSDDEVEEDEVVELENFEHSIHERLRELARKTA